MRSVIIGTLLFVALPVFAFSQSPWLRSERYPQVTVEVMKPYFRNTNLLDSSHPSPLSSYMFVTANYPVNNYLHFVMDLPLSHWGYRDPEGPDNQADNTAIGNTYLGIELHHIIKNVFFELGMRLPTMSQPDYPDRRGGFTGMVSSYDRSSAFISDYIPINIIGNVVYPVSGITSIRLRAGILHGSYTNKKDYYAPPKNDLYVLYSLGFYFEGKVINGTFGFSDHYNTSLKKTYKHRERLGMLYAAVEKPFGNYTIGLNLRVPSSDIYYEQISMVLGAKVTIHI